MTVLGPRWLPAVLVLQILAVTGAETATNAMKGNDTKAIARMQRRVSADTRAWSSRTREIAGNSTRVTTWPTICTGESSTRYARE